VGLVDAESIPDAWRMPPTVVVATTDAPLLARAAPAGQPTVYDSV